MMQTDVKSGYADASGSITDYRSRVKGILIAYEASGSVDIYDTATTPGLGQNPVFHFVAGTVGGTVNIPVPGEGILCADGIYADVTDAAVTVFYG